MAGSYKKVLFVCPYFYPQVGGLENFVFNLTKELNHKYGWEIVIVTSNHIENKYQEEKINGIKVYRLATWLKVSNTPINPLWFFHIKKIINKEKPDLINAHAPVPFIADIAALVCGQIPFVLTYHAGSMKKNVLLDDFFITLYENILLRLLAQKAQKIICVSRFIKNTLFKNVLTKCVIIHPGVNVSLFKPSIKKIRKTKQILFICRYAKMAEMKGLNDLIQAMKMIRGIKLKIIGEKGKIRSSRIKYLGVKTGQDLVKEIQSSNVLVLCPRAHAESFGMVLIEAMACKIPVIGTNIGGIPEVIQHGVDGMIVPSNHPGKLAGAINKILSDDQQANKMVETAYRKVHHYFTWNHQARATIKLFNSLI